MNSCNNKLKAQKRLLPGFMDQLFWKSNIDELNNFLFSSEINDLDELVLSWWFHRDELLEYLRIAPFVSDIRRQVLNLAEITVKEFIDKKFNYYFERTVGSRSLDREVGLIKLLYSLNGAYCSINVSQIFQAELLGSFIIRIFLRIASCFNYCLIKPYNQDSWLTETNQEHIKNIEILRTRCKKAYYRLIADQSVKEEFTAFAILKGILESWANIITLSVSLSEDFLESVVDDKNVQFLQDYVNELLYTRVIDDFSYSTPQGVNVHIFKDKQRYSKCPWSIICEFWINFLWDDFNPDLIVNKWVIQWYVSSTSLEICFLPGFDFSMASLGTNIYNHLKFLVYSGLAHHLESKPDFVPQSFIHESPSNASIEEISSTWDNEVIDKEIIKSRTKLFPWLSWRIVKNAIIKICGQPIRIKWSHHIFKWLNWTIWPIPIHAWTIAPKTLDNFLKKVWISYSQFEASL